MIKRLPERTKTIVELCIESGMRISDALNLKPDEIKNPMTVYETKSKRERTFELSEELFEKLQRVKEFNSNASLVFRALHRDAKRMSRSTIHRHIKKALNGLDFEASAHSTRKLYAQNILNETGDIGAVQKALNHKSILTTATYLDINLQKLIQEVTKLDRT